MMTAMNIPEITISPLDFSKGMPDETLFKWRMKVCEEMTLDSYDHGDVFSSVEEALADAYAEFHNLSDERHLIPVHTEQEFKVTISQGLASAPASPPPLHLV